MSYLSFPCRRLHFHPFQSRLHVLQRRRRSSSAALRLRRRQSTAAALACTRRSPTPPSAASAARTLLQCRPRATRAFHDAHAAALRCPCRLRLFHATCTFTPPLHSAALRHMRHSRIAQPAPRILRHRRAASNRSRSTNPAMHHSCSRRRDGS